MWKTIRSKVIFSHPRITLIEDDVVLPDGSKTKYLKYEKPADGVTIICRRDDGKILLQKEYSYPVGKALWQFPGGGLKAGETTEQGAQRELSEEAGYHASRLELLGKYYVDNRRSNALMFVHAAQDLKETTALKPDKEESFESFWVAEKELDRLIAENEIVNYSVLAAWSFYKASSL